MKLKVLSALLVSAVCLASAHAAPFVAVADINGNSSSYSGTNPGFGYVSDGGFDAFDGFGYYSNGTAGLSLQREVQLLSDLNTYRWVDTFTNNTGAAFSGVITFFGDLGSDGSETVTASDGFHKVSHENWDSGPFDPVLALVNGNNAWALSHTNAIVGSGGYYDNMSFNLAVGESVSVAHFAILVRPDDISSYYPASPSTILAEQLAQGLIANPSAYWTGLSQSQINSIANFDTNAVPEPASMALVATGLFGVMAARRRRKA